MTPVLARTYPAVATAYPWQLPSPSDFPAYARAANAMPMMTAEDEAACVAAWQEHHDKEAARRLVLSHLRLVIRSVKNHQGYGMAPGDLAQEGTVGLMKAVHRFSPAVGVRLAVYAIRWIEAEIREFIFRNLRQVRLSSTKSLRKLFFGYRQAVNKLQDWTGEQRGPTLSDQEWASVLEVSADDIRLIEQYFGGGDQSLMMVTDEDGDHETERPLMSRLPSPYQAHDDTASDPFEGVVMDDASRGSQALHDAIALLGEREQAIVRARWLSDSPRGLADLGQQWGVSAERIRQVEQQALRKLRQSLAETGEMS